MKRFNKVLLYVIVPLLVLVSFLLDSTVSGLMRLASHPLLDAFFIFYTNSLMLLGLFVVLPALVLLFRGQKRNAAIVVATAIAAFMISSGLKLVFERSRPETVLFNLASGWSLPSTHAMVAFSVVPALMLFFPFLALLVISAAALMGFSRR